MHNGPFQHATEIVGYTYEADVHCLTCAKKRFPPDIYGYLDGEDNEGNPIHPMFACDLLEREYCGDCWEEIE